MLTQLKMLMPPREASLIWDISVFPQNFAVSCRWVQHLNVAWELVFPFLLLFFLNNASCLCIVSVRHAFFLATDFVVYKCFIIFNICENQKEELSFHNNRKTLDNPAAIPPPWSQIWVHSQHVFLGVCCCLCSVLLWPWEWQLLHLRALGQELENCFWARLDHQCWGTLQSRSPNHLYKNSDIMVEASLSILSIQFGIY